MAQLSDKIRAYLDRKVDFMKDVILHDDGDGVAYIAEWNVEEAQPTEEQLNALESQADTLRSNKLVILERGKLYGTAKEQFEYIVENGIDAFIAKQQQIKSDNPKT